VITQDEAVRILEDGYSRIGALLDRLSAEDLTRPGIGSDNWTPQDLIGHVAFWEKAAFEALDAWAMGAASPIDRALHRGVDTVNAEALKRIRSQSLEAVREDAARTHTGLLISIQEMGEALWESPPTARHVHSIGDSLGRILVGPGGPFTHAEAHIPDLQAFVDQVSPSG
jgi:hypothetical protein